MRMLFALLFALLGPLPLVQSCGDEPERRFPTDEILATIRTHCVHAKQVQWTEWEKEVRARLDRTTTDDEKAKAFVYLFSRMQDVHSHLLVQGRSYAHYEGLDDDARRKLQPLLTLERAHLGKPVAQMLEGKIGYVLVPGMQASSPEEVAKSAKALHACVAELAAKNPVGWIVDLRLNGGGNLTPMLLGLAPLLGEGVVGGTLDAEGRTVQRWVLKRDGLYWRDRTGDRRFAKLDLTGELPATRSPVAVLIGPITRSSGQATALAFRGRPHCTLLGEPTAKGYTTVTTPFRIGPQVSLSLAVGYMADRDLRACKRQVLPDMVVDGAHDFQARENDPKVQAAKRWLAEQTR